ncbi:MADS-box protein [Morus notabilis]|uniref:MADS-box protein n=1 Tax=Morus notabilis TaxID=981085 RepID=W9SAQ3_9ROSA|nr:MADS-box protein [Morus notabilis]
MGRGTLPLRLIPKERARRITFAKRKKGLLKKAYELSTLCDVKVCVIIYDTTNQLSDDHHYHHQHDHRHDYHHQQAVYEPIHTWPEQPHEVESIIAKYLAYKAKNPVSKKDLDIADFFKEKIKKIQHDTKKLAEENKIKKIMMLKSGSTDHHQDHHDYDQFDLLWDNRIDGFSLTQLLDLMTHLDNRISDANNHWTDRYNSNMMIMCMTPHDKYYYDIDHHGHHSNYQFGSTSMSPMMGNSYQTSSEYRDNYNNNHELVLFPQYDHYYDPQYYWPHDQPASSSKTVPFDHHSSFTSMMLNGHDPTDYNEDIDCQYYSNLLNIGTKMFNNNNTSVGAVTNAMNTDHDHVVLHHQNGVFLNNHADVAMQPYGMPLFGGTAADGSGYSPAGNQFRASSSQQDVKFCDNQLHGFGRV